MNVVAVVVVVADVADDAGGRQSIRRYPRVRSSDHPFRRSLRHFQDRSSTPSRSYIRYRSWDWPEVGSVAGNVGVVGVVDPGVMNDFGAGFDPGQTGLGR